jgi:hypothetical protein
MPSSQMFFLLGHKETCETAITDPLVWWWWRISFSATIKAPFDSENHKSHTWSI